MTFIFWSPCCSVRRAFLLLSFSLSVSSISAQPATLPFYDCFTGNASQKFSVDTVYSQIINELTLNITILGNTSQQIVASANSNSLCAHISSCFFNCPSHALTSKLPSSRKLRHLQWIHSVITQLYATHYAPLRLCNLLSAQIPHIVPSLQGRLPSPPLYHSIPGIP
jgi:hypothetical protein